VRKKPRKDTHAVCHKVGNKKENSHFDNEHRLREKKTDDTKVYNTGANITAWYGSMFSVLESLWDWNGFLATKVNSSMYSSLTKNALFNLKTHENIYIKIHINIAPTCFGLRPSSGSVVIYYAVVWQHAATQPHNK